LQDYDIFHLNKWRTENYTFTYMYTHAPHTYLFTK